MRPTFPFLVLALAGCAAPLEPAPSRLPGAVRPRPPNVVVVLVDDLGWTDLGVYGSSFYETPNIDRLAVEGLRFTSAYAACAVCSPTRAALMTGRYPARVGITDWIRSRFQGGAIPADGKNPSGWAPAGERPLSCPRNPLWLEHEEVTLAEALGAGGWTSAHVGKWHLGFDGYYPTDQGFDVNHGGCDYGQPPSYFDPYSNGKPGTDSIPTLPPREEGEYLTDREADEAARFVRENAGRPFFLHLAPYAVHTPIQAHEPVAARYRAKPVAEGQQQKNAAYASMVEGVDRAVGVLLDALDEAGVAEDTLVIFTSDNGGLLGPTHNAPLRAGKGHPYEGGIRVPMIVRWKGTVPAGTVSDTPVSSIDVLPTVLAAAGLELPAGRAIDGVSLLEHVTSGGREPLDRDELYWHFPHYRSKAIGPYSIVRSGRWKLIRWWEGGRSELYDLEADLSEAHELSAERAGLTRELEGRLDAHLAQVGARLPRPAGTR